jgi:UDP-N-acetylmuramoylalanine--D-glutamate ligase
MLDFSQHTVLVLGLGESGLAIARWVGARGAALRVADTRAAPPGLAALQAELPQAQFQDGEFSTSLLDGVTLVALSPGLSPDRSAAAPLLAEARSRGLPVFGEMEFFARALASLADERGYRPRVVGITGTNGKTTTTRLAGLLIERTGRRVAVAGNISPTALDTLRERLAADDLPEVWVLELSSFQLATCETLVCDAATVLNLTQDHLDWHGSMDAYAEAKARIFGPFTQRVLNRDDPRVRAMQPPPVERPVRVRASRPARAALAGRGAARASTAASTPAATAVDPAEAMRIANTAVSAAPSNALAAFWPWADSMAPAAAADALAPVADTGQADADLAPGTGADAPAAVAGADRVDAGDAAPDDEPISVAERIAEAERLTREKAERGERVPPHPVTFGVDAPTQPDEYGLVRDGGITWLAWAEDLSMGHRRRKAAAELPGVDGQVFVHKLMPVDALRIRGRHNAMNALAALALARAIGCPLAPMLHALATYGGEPHRVALVETIDGVEYYDDSKGTNVGATVAALEGLGAEGKRLVVILGGDGKGQDFSPLVAPLAAHARGVVLIGRDGPAIGALLQAAVYPVHTAVTLPEAVTLCARIAQRGDAVLLSPACASLDMFRNYPHRAQVFVEAVRALAADQGAAA